jgi:hypothetical protein
MLLPEASVLLFYPHGVTCIFRLDIGVQPLVLHAVAVEQLVLQDLVLLPESVGLQPLVSCSVTLDLSYGVTPCVSYAAVCALLLPQ